MISKKKTLLAGGLAAAISCTTAIAQEATSPFTWGGDVRLRQIFVDNVGLDADSKTADRTFERLRTRLWGNYAFDQNVSVKARLLWEGRHYQSPNRSDYPPLENWYSGGIFFDLLHVDAKNIAGLPLSVRIGRQEIMLGNGWLVFEGTPIDGSRTFSFDAARATYSAEDIGTTFDLIYIDENPDTGRFPQALNGEVEDQTEQHETGVVLYANNKTLLDGDLDGYFIYKHDDPNNTPGNIRVNNGYPFASPGNAGDIYALGGRADTNLTENWALRAEAVYQWGTRNDRDLSAFGLNSRLNYNFNDALKNQLHASYEYLSGDDPNSDEDEGFDPLWGRWPQWSELMVYQWPLDGRVAGASNLHRLNLGWTAQVHPTTWVLLDYHALWAAEQYPSYPSQVSLISGDDSFRGHLFTGWIRTKLNKNVSGHLVAEYLMPGDYYAENRRNDSFFVRAELIYTW
ncbi:alginate export family protein [Thiorhodococcus fuscus]|uniref:Alginate export family protein n=1 Tax=Thiorhodococcus fuscus TaxID=527200 RepID=A0ABW4Y601_9GAMM